MYEKKKWCCCVQIMHYLYTFSLSYVTHFILVANAGGVLWKLCQERGSTNITPLVSWWIACNKQFRLCNNFSIYHNCNSWSISYTKLRNTFLLLAVMTQHYFLIASEGAQNVTLASTVLPAMHETTYHTMTMIVVIRHTTCLQSLYPDKPICETCMVRLVRLEHDVLTSPGTRWCDECASSKRCSRDARVLHSFY